MSDKKQGAFDALIEEIKTAGGDIADMAKSMPAAEDTSEDDEKIEDAAEEGDEGDEKDEAPMGKSFKLTLEDGTTVDAVDGADLVKSLMARIEETEKSTAEALTGAVSLVKELGTLVKSQGVELAALKSAGKGRKAVVTVAEKPASTAETLAKSDEPAGLSGEEFMAKALTAQAEGKISGLDVSIAESHINGGKSPPANIVRAVLG
jgi:hypothetical protein